MEGCRAAAGWSESSRKRFRSVPRYAAPHTSVIASHRRWRGNPVNYARAYAPCAYPRICSNCASACFHILGFIASETKQSSKLCRRVCVRLYYSLDRHGRNAPPRG